MEFRGQTSKMRNMQQWVPQGGVLSPALFNSYMSSIPTSLHNITLVSPADDITICSSSIKPGELATWLEDRSLILSMGKSSATLFKTWTKELNRPLNIKMAGSALLSKPTVKILEVMFDEQLKFSHHAAILGGKIGQRNNIMKKLAVSGWVCTKEVLTTYKVVGCSVLNYVAPIWTPILSDSRWKDLQRRQNAALQTVTGCHTMASELHLHETKVMPVREHNKMLRNTVPPWSPSTGTARSPEGKPPPPLPQQKARRARPTLPDRLGDNVAELMTLENLDTGQYRAGLANIYWAYITEVWSPPAQPQCLRLIHGSSH